MPDPTINVYRDLLVPVGTRLSRDPRFAGIMIIYDVEEEIPFSQLPAIEYYAETPWQDTTRGSGGYSPQTRTLTARIGFNVVVFNAQHREKMEENLFYISGHLLDWLRESKDFDRAAGFAGTNTPITWDVQRAASDQGYLGVHKIVAEFNCFGGTGR